MRKSSQPQRTGSWLEFPLHSPLGEASGFSAYILFPLADDPTQDLGDILGNLPGDKCFVSETSSGKPIEAVPPTV